tara:strand:- start:112 stop:696 length:585 start_codon:yes stop_codon:yes gene_type:complete
MGKPTLAEIVGKLTAKQKKFAEGLVFGGLSKAESYRQAYKWNGNSQSGMRVSATRTSQKTNVALALKAMEEDKTARWWADKAKLQTFVMEGLTSTAQTTESDITKLKAFELLGRTRYASIFEEPQANESTAELHGSIIDTIQSRLAMLLSSADTIDITPTAARGGKARRGTVSTGDRLDLGHGTDTLTGGGEGG